LDAKRGGAAPSRQAFTKGTKLLKGRKTICSKTEKKRRRARLAVGPTQGKKGAFSETKRKKGSHDRGKKKKKGKLAIPFGYPSRFVSLAGKREKEKERTAAREERKRRASIRKTGRQAADRGKKKKKGCRGEREGKRGGEKNCSVDEVNQKKKIARPEEKGGGKRGRAGQRRKKGRP